MTFVLHFMSFIMKLMVQHMGDTFLTLTDLDYLTKTYHFETIPFITIERSIFISFTTGIFTKIDYLRINKFNLP